MSSKSEESTNGSDSKTIVDLITLDDSSNNKHKEENTNGSDSKTIVDLVTLDDSSNNQLIEENTNGDDSKTIVDLVTLDESSDNIPVKINNDDSEENDSQLNEFIWELDADGEEVQQIDEEKEKLSETKISEVPVDIPRYNKDFTGYLTEKEYSIETGKHMKNDAPPGKRCFNCLGNHSLHECKDRKDFNAIARNRRAILGKKVSSVRYHKDVENKYGSFRAGQISENLRQALGLRDTDAPEYIYRMRILGYPPGWLKDAEANRSDLSLFDGTGKPISHPEEEEGETDERLTKYHPEKLVSYPGFNVPLPHDIEDQHRQLNYPPMQDHHNRKAFLHFMTKNKASKYKRKKLRNEVPRSIPEVQLKSGDMEVEELQDASSKIEFNPPLPEETAKPPEPAAEPSSPVKEIEDGELSEDSNEVKGAERRIASPPHTPTQENGSSPSPTLVSSTKRKESPEDANLQTPKMTPSRHLSKRQHRSSSKGFTLGVSIPESITPFKILPESTKWSVDVSDHILFDNLPDALGTWQQLRGLVTTVRTTMQELHAEEDDE